MAVTGCRETVEWFTAKQAADGEFRLRLRSLLGAPSLDLEAVATLVTEHEPAIGAIVAQQFKELPRPATLAILRTWSDAADLGLAFRLVSEPPAEPLAFARRRLVRLAIEVDEEGVAVRLSHMPGRHPTWVGPGPLIELGDAVAALVPVRPSARGIISVDIGSLNL